MFSGFFLVSFSWTECDEVLFSIDQEDDADEIDQTTSSHDEDDAEVIDVSEVLGRGPLRRENVLTPMQKGKMVKTINSPQGIYYLFTSDALVFESLCKLLNEDEMNMMAYLAVLARLHRFVEKVKDTSEPIGLLDLVDLMWNHLF